MKRLVDIFHLNRKEAYLALIVGVTVLGSLLGLKLLPDDWPIWRKALAGAIGGLGSGFFILGSRLAGAYRDDED